MESKKNKLIPCFCLTKFNNIHVSIFNPPFPVIIEPLEGNWQQSNKVSIWNKIQAPTAKRFLDTRTFHCTQKIIAVAEQYIDIAIKKFCLKFSNSKISAF